MWPRFVVVDQGQAGGAAARQTRDVQGLGHERCLGERVEEGPRGGTDDEGTKLLLYPSRSFVSLKVYTFTLGSTNALLYPFRLRSFCLCRSTYTRYDRFEEGAFLSVPFLCLCRSTFTAVGLRSENGNPTVV